MCWLAVYSEELTRLAARRIANYDSICRLVDAEWQLRLEPAAVHSLPLLVREKQSDNCANSGAPLGADARCAPISFVVRATRASWIVHESGGHRSSDRTARRALDHACGAIYAATDIEPDDGCARNC